MPVMHTKSKAVHEGRLDRDHLLSMLHEQRFVESEAKAITVYVLPPA